MVLVFRKTSNDSCCLLNIGDWVELHILFSWHARSEMIYRVLKVLVYFCYLTLFTIILASRWMESQCYEYMKFPDIEEKCRQ